MANVEILNILYNKGVDPLQFKWDNLVGPNVFQLLSYNDVVELNKIAMSIRLSSKPQEKYRLIKNILEPRGFKFLVSGTNRAVFKYLEIPSIVIKVAIDRVGINDNGAEFKNQFLLRPFVTKVFSVTPCGTVGVFERVQPLVNKYEFEQIAGDIFNLIVEHIVGKYVLEDIGTKFFMNYGIREQWGPVLLDFPYVYELDGNKLICNVIDPMTGIPCCGEIDYDAGFNKLICCKCGRQYFANELKTNESETIIVKSRKKEIAMKISIVQGNEVLETIEKIPEMNSTAIEEPVVKPISPKVEYKPGDVVVSRKGKYMIHDADSVEVPKESFLDDVLNEDTEYLDEIDLEENYAKDEEETETNEEESVASYVTAASSPYCESTEESTNIEIETVDDLIETLKSEEAEPNFDIDDQGMMGMPRIRKEFPLTRQYGDGIKYNENISKDDIVDGEFKVDTNTFGINNEEKEDEECMIDDIKATKVENNVPVYEADMIVNEKDEESIDDEEDDYLIDSY